MSGDSKMKLYVFSGPHGGYTSGVTVSLGKSREDAINKVLAKLQRSAELNRIFDVHYRALVAAYDKVFVRNPTSSWAVDGGWAVKVEGADTPFPEDTCQFQWQKVWNALLPFPDNDDDRVIREALHAALPSRMQFCSFGTADTDINRFKSILEECNVAEGTLVVTDAVDDELKEFVVIQGGGD